MVSDQLAFIRQTWALAAADPDQTARVFYANLFRLDPTTKPLFKGDMASQGRKLTDTLVFIVDNLETLDVLVPAAEDLAVRHLAYGVTKAQYKSVGDALIATFKKLLGSNFSAEAEAAWIDIYGVLADVMISKAYTE